MDGACMAGGWNVGGCTVGGVTPGIAIPGRAPGALPAEGGGGAAPPMLERCIICVYSLGPCCCGGGGGDAPPGGAIGDMNAPVAPEDCGNAGCIGCCGGGGADAASGLPNMLVNSPGGLPADAWGADCGGGGGNPEDAGNCGDGLLPGAGDLK